MICISIAQVSRRLALADMHNAAPQCDLLEIRLDLFEKAPELSELLAHAPKPVIFSCRREGDGGAWSGTEAERLALLRAAIVSKPAYVEIELDVADQIRRFPPAKRLISYTNPRQTPPDIADKYAQALTKDPDAIKLETLAQTPEEAWPLVQILGTSSVPTIVVGLGKPGLMLTVLSKKIGAPWVYAALEKGMEAYPGQPTVRDLAELYRYGEIEHSTRLVGVTGTGEREVATLAALNVTLAHLDEPLRCLPLTVGNVSLFRKIISAIHLNAVIVDPEHARDAVQVADEVDATAEQLGEADLLVRQKKVWRAYNTLAGASLAELAAGLAARGRADRPLKDRMVMLVGVNTLARVLASLIKEQGGVPIIASHDRAGAQAIAHALECRYVAFEALYTTMHDALIVCDEEKNRGPTKGTAHQAGIHPGYLKPAMTVLDLTCRDRPSALLRAARGHGCVVVSPRMLLRSQLGLQLGRLTERAVAPEILDEVLNERLSDEASENEAGTQVPPFTTE